MPEQHREVLQIDFPPGQAQIPLCSSAVHRSIQTCIKDLESNHWCILPQPIMPYTTAMLAASTTVQSACDFYGSSLLTAPLASRLRSDCCMIKFDEEVGVNDTLRSTAVHALLLKVQLHVLYVDALVCVHVHRLGVPWHFSCICYREM